MEMAGAAEEGVWVWLATWPAILRAQPRADAAGEARRCALASILSELPDLAKLLQAHGLENEIHPSCILGVVRIKAAFTHDPLQTLDTVQSIHRAFWAYLACGLSNVGHLHYLEVLDTTPIPPLLWPAGPRKRSLFGSLPRWLVDALADILVKAPGGPPPWFQHQGPLDCYLALPAEFCALVIHRRTRCLSVCELGRTRLDIPELYCSIGWKVQKEGGYRGHTP